MCQYHIVNFKVKIKNEIKLLKDQFNKHNLAHEKFSLKESVVHLSRSMRDSLSFSFLWQWQYQGLHKSASNGMTNLDVSLWIRLFMTTFCFGMSEAFLYRFTVANIIAYNCQTGLQQNIENKSCGWQDRVHLASFFGDTVEMNPYVLPWKLWHYVSDTAKVAVIMYTRTFRSSGYEYLLF